VGRPGKALLGGGIVPSTAPLVWPPGRGFPGWCPSGWVRWLCCLVGRCGIVCPVVAGPGIGWWQVGFGCGPCRLEHWGGKRVLGHGCAGIAGWVLTWYLHGCGEQRPAAESCGVAGVVLTSGPDSLHELPAELILQQARVPCLGPCLCQS